MSGKLYVVGTPIGNLGDFSPRAVQVLEDVDFIAAEDTRVTLKLLNHFGIKKEMISYFEHNKSSHGEIIISRLLNGETCAICTDAGMPAISDPGFLLSRECRRHGIEVECLPGATAFVPAIVNSGLPCDRFCFEGFLPQKKGRATRLASLAEEQRTMIFYESPLRLVKTLEQLAATFGAEREASVCREISKVHNTTHHGTLGELVEEFTATAPRGEIVIVVAGKAAEAAAKVDKYADFKQKSAHRE